MWKYILKTNNRKYSIVYSEKNFDGMGILNMADGIFYKIISKHSI
jgi:hypothetical protein